MKEDVLYSLQSMLVVDEIARLEGLASEEEIVNGMINDGTYLDEVVMKFLMEKAVVK